MLPEGVLHRVPRRLGASPHQRRVKDLLLDEGVGEQRSPEGAEDRLFSVESAAPRCVGQFLEHAAQLDVIALEQLHRVELTPADREAQR